ncbi:RDD family protein [Nocardioides dokdonensis FR1436]|uniref:RDD family protein n=1 Tax=Nocardioides dokdonensis FR1436 TaxID=1300347 RepID=A0A1A9GFW0_9ACTN|nr:RDD family protein [Nocardioides dokdonensis]ANH36946.1 RDD family protein [Nocardioides dokdonensis FR1436]
MSDLAAPAAARVDLPTADLDRRFYAHVVDRAVAWTAYAAAAGLGWWLLPGPGVTVARLLLVVGWFVVVQVLLAALLGLRGLSPGKALLGLRAVSASTGRPVGVPYALLRGLVVAVAGLPTLFLGAATLAWTSAADRDRQRRGWHDHLAGSVVVDVRPVPEAGPEAEARPRAIVNLTAMRLVPTPPTPPRAAPSATPAPTSPPPPTPPRPSGPPPSAPPPGTSPPRTPPPSTPPPSSPPPSTPPVSPAPVRPARPVEAPAGGWVVHLDSGEQLVVDGLVLLGRGPVGRAGEEVRHLVPLRSQDMSVSKTHAQLQVAPDGALVVLDRGSTNGSVVIRSGVPRDLAAGTPLTLLDGDTLRLGDRSLRVVRQG